MKEKETQWQTADGLTLFARQWKPETEKKGAICLVYGLGEHSGRYQHWAERLAGAGFSTFSFDLRGHGRSEGQRGDSPSIDHLADEIGIMLDHARAEFPGLPCFLYGHSMGGMLALFYLIQRRPRLSGAIITSPLLHSVLDQRKDRIAMMKILNYVIPWVSISNSLDTESLSRDPAVTAAYRNDPLVHDRVTFRMGKGFIDTINYIFNRAGELNMPLLLMHGTEDRITFPSGSEKLCSLVSGGCKLKLWAGLYHELHNEPEKEQVFAYLKDWLNKQFKQA